MLESYGGAVILLIPVINSFVGWFTNWLAIKMMFYPVNFVGIRPLLGWQGIIPAQTEELSKKFSLLISEQLVDVSEIIGDLNSDRKLTEPLVSEMTEAAVEAISTQYAPKKWAKLAPPIQTQVKTGITKSIKKIVADLLEEMAESPEKMIDIDAIIHQSMVKDRGLLGHFITEIAGPELKFIEKSGLWFGFLFGLLQLAVWMLYPQQWMLPIGGFLVGYVTNFLALTLLFEPSTPRKLGPWVIQGVFIKRQTEVATKFANVIVNSIFTLENLASETLQGNKRESLMAMAEEKINTALDREQKNPILARLFGKDMINDMRADLLAGMHNLDPKKIKSESLETVFAERTQKLHQQLDGNLSKLKPDEFNNILRPVFKADEWKLILAGAVLGTGAGALQMLFIVQ